ncbi:hypothetical protein CEY15_13455 [Dietzia natronolimnaea]|uniref:ABC transporter permease n=1 Tax=Dietzia natronolimnaea TaxID=161920 RepID=A0A2A2WME9_9ACTN|nr:ABC transporter permease [Dietzia natronolimnaea]PAY22389.1 hypothetical protein CEY15_13455 [Dietzia natronolimnaea]
MVFHLPAGRGPVRDLAGQVGSLVGYSVFTLLSCVRTVVTGRLSLAETRDQALFVARVCLVPALLLMLPVGVLVAVSVGELAGRLGAAGYAGAVVAFVVVGQASALVCALMLAGVGGSAICADLGSRTIREEVEAMEVMGLDVIERLVVPRVIATVLVSMVLCALVTAMGVTACLIYQVYGQGESAGVSGGHRGGQSTGAVAGAHAHLPRPAARAQVAPADRASVDPGDSRGSADRWAKIDRSAS